VNIYDIAVLRKSFPGYITLFKGEGFILLRYLLSAIALLILCAANPARADETIIGGDNGLTQNCKTASAAGAIRYNSTTTGIQYCDGVSWKAIGGMALISTQTASASASLQWTGLGSSYQYYQLNCSGLTPSTAALFEVQVGEGGTPTWETSGYTIDMEYTAATGGWTGGGSLLKLLSFGSIIERHHWNDGYS
jgi:hypothetical protein